MPDNILEFPKSKTKSILSLNAKADDKDKFQLDMFGVVGGDFWSDGGITRDTVSKILKDIPKSIDRVEVRLDSPGGDVFEGRAIANMMKDHRVDFDVNILAECCSIATIIAMAGDTIHMSEGSVFLVHRCYTIAIGNSQEMRKLADDLERIDVDLVNTYKKKTKMKEKDLFSLMDENRYMRADEAKKLGFVDSISDDGVSNFQELRIAALDIDRSKFHLPPFPIFKDQPRRKAALAALSRIQSI